MNDDAPHPGPEASGSGPGTSGAPGAPTPDPTGPTAPTGGSSQTAGPGHTAGPGEPPPLTAFAWRNGLVRPTQGRLLAGVCGALGRATNTDPVLWRVVIGVLTLFGGVGIVLYLLGWILLPADGDTASPIEALVWRGHSATSTTLTVIVGVAVLLSFGAVFSQPFRPGLLGGVLVAAAILLLLRDRRNRTAPPFPGPTVGSAGPAPADAPYDAPAPFAPRGPFVPVGTPGGPPIFAAPFPRPPRPPKPPKSRLGGLTFSIALVVLGGMFLVSQAGYRFPVAGYLAAALAVVGLGLVIGTWIGRGRGLIALGIILTVALSSVTASNHVPARVGSRTIAPSSVAQLQSSYNQDVGDFQVDLSEIDFANQDVTVTFDLTAGNLVILLPSNVDTVVDAKIHVGNAKVFGEEWNGLGLDPRTVTDNGDDGPGGGHLHINASVSVGNLEVHR